MNAWSSSPASERQRQVHHGQTHRRYRAADLRPDPARRRGHHPHVHHRARPPRHQLLLSSSRCASKGITVFDLISIASGKKLSTNEACTYLSEVGLCARDYVNREVNASLSGGELKRIEIATMLARGTKMSIFDEPEAGIDLWSFRISSACSRRCTRRSTAASSSSRIRAHSRDGR